MKDNWRVECRYPDMVTGKSSTAIVDFATFAIGNSAMTGRGKLLKRIWPAACLLFANLSPNTARQTKHLIRRFWTFLDQMDSLRAISLPGSPPIDDLDWEELELLWRHWVDWLRASKLGERQVARTFWFVKKIFETAFELERERGATAKETLELFGYFKIPIDIRVSETLSVEDARRMFKAIRSHWLESVTRIAQFNDLALKGRPHWKVTKGRESRREANYWARLENRLWFVKRFFPWTRGWCSKCPVKDVSANLLRYEVPQWAPIIPWAKRSRKLWAHLGAVFFSADDLALAIAMVAMKTPLNSSTIGSLRASNWYIGPISIKAVLRLSGVKSAATVHHGHHKETKRWLARKVDELKAMAGRGKFQKPTALKAADTKNRETRLAQELAAANYKIGELEAKLSRLSDGKSRKVVQLHSKRQRSHPASIKR